MSKRELRAGAEVAEGSRPKRQRKETVVEEESSDVDITMADVTRASHKGIGVGSGRGEDSIREQGLKLWQTVKDAVNKEGRLISLDFLRKPSKKLYPDYYKIIQKPIALDDIKKQLDSNAYPSLEAVRLDFELCFNNAKQYNMKDSEIWKHAKELLKLVHKTYNSLQPGEDDDDEGDWDGKKDKTKGPSLTRLMNKRLQKLVEKTDDSGRPLSTEFMALPSKKEWPIYYQEIKHPQCIDNIFKRIRRKEYPSMAEFMSDVELVFSNAMTFNLEHTQIWEDARTLRDFFRHLMVDVAPPDQTKPANGKLKIKMPPSQTALQHSSSGQSTQPSLLLRVPGLSNTSKPSQTSPLPSDSAISTTTAPSAAVSNSQPGPSNSSTATSSPVATTTSPHPPKNQGTSNATRSHHGTAASSRAPVAGIASQSTQQKSQAKAVAPSPVPKVATPAPAPPQIATQPSQYPYTPLNFSHYPNATYHLPATPARTPSVAPQPIAPNLAQSVSASPAPGLMHPSHQLKSVLIETESRGRKIHLDHRDGVKCWMFRLERGDTSIRVSDVTFLGDEEEESSGDEDEDKLDKQEEEEDEDDLEHEPPTRSSKKKKTKGRGRPRGSGRAAALAKARAAKAAKKRTPSMKIGDLEVKLNGVLMEMEDGIRGSSSAWVLKLGVGMNTVEIGEQGGMIWKVYIDRLRD